MNKENRDRERMIEESLAVISPTNRGDAGRFLELKRAQGRRANTRRLLARSLDSLDTFLNGRSFASTKEEDIIGFASMRWVGRFLRILD